MRAPLPGATFGGRIDFRGDGGASALIAAAEIDDPEAMMVVCPADATMPVPAAPYGRYEVVLDGSIGVEGRTLGAAALRYVVGDEQPMPLEIGPDGARLMLLSFDADAKAGGLGNDQLSRAAAEAIIETGWPNLSVLPALMLRARRESNH